jgi:hypothetical protein
MYAIAILCPVGQASISGGRQEESEHKIRKKKKKPGIKFKLGTLTTKKKKSDVQFLPYLPEYKAQNRGRRTNNQPGRPIESS